MNYVAANVTVPFMAVPNDQDSCFLCEIDEEGGVGTQEEGAIQEETSQWPLTEPWQWHPVAVMGQEHVGAVTLSADSVYMNTVFWIRVGEENSLSSPSFSTSLVSSSFGR